MFNALQNFDTLNTKDKLFALLDVAAQIVEHDVKIEGFTIDDADADDAFAELQAVLRTVVDTVDYYVD